jgi:hypothetical protein
MRNLAGAVFAVWIVSHAAIVQGQPLTITTIAGPAEEHGSADGNGGVVGFFNPGGLATDRAGNV